MPLSEELEQHGAWLFRHRSFVPPALLAGIVAAAAERPGRDAVPGLESAWVLAGMGVAVGGLLVRAAVIGSAPAGTSGKNRSGQVAASLTTTGLYSVVRHPLYLGNLLLWLGPAIAAATWWGVGIVALGFALYYERIMFAEEAFLRRTFGADYLAWAGSTPAILPAVSRWRRPALPFSFRTVLRQEYYAFFSTGLMFALLELATVWRESGRVSLPSEWLAGLVFLSALAGTLRFLQRYTRVLNVEGR